MQGKLLFELIGCHSMEWGSLQSLYKFCTTFSGTKNTHEQAIFLVSHKQRQAVLQSSGYLLVQAYSS
jgi:hypothetical protein